MSKISDTSKYGFNYFKIQDPRSSLEIRPYQVELEKTQLEDKKHVLNSVKEIRRDFETLKCEVFKLQNKENIDKDYLRKKMYKMEEKISCLKDTIKEKLLTLLIDEVNLLKDIQFVERKIEDWGKSIDIQIFKPVRQSNYKATKVNVPNAATEFQKFLSSFGEHYGGWEERDHLLFLKERGKHKEKEKFFTTLHCLLPDLSYEEIEKHEKWYQKYQCLKKCQKEAIQKWRLEKDTQQKKNSEKEEKNDLQKQVKKSFRHQINIAERIKEWKNQQLLKKLEEEERQKKEKEKLKEEEKRKKEMQQMKKLAVTKYKAEKLGKAQEIFAKENILQERETKARNKILLEAFRLQDLKFIEKKKVIRLQIESKSNAKMKRLKLAKPALEFILQRNPKRVFQPTLIWNQHCLESQKKEKVDLVFDLNSIPRLAIPEWRRELK